MLTYDGISTTSSRRRRRGARPPRHDAHAGRGRTRRRRNARTWSPPCLRKNGTCGPRGRSARCRRGGTTTGPLLDPLVRVPRAVAFRRRQAADVESPMTCATASRTRPARWRGEAGADFPRGVDGRFEGHESEAAKKRKFTRDGRVPRWIADGYGGQPTPAPRVCGRSRPDQAPRPAKAATPARAHIALKRCANVRET